MNVPLVAALSGVITFDLTGGRFNYRAAAIIIEDGHVLLCRLASHSWWFLPGGRCEFDETSQETVSRELDEELGTSVAIERLIWIIENYFFLAGRRFHEIGLYYLVALPRASPLTGIHQPIVPREADGEYRWFPLSGLGDVDLRPAFLKLALQDIPDQTRHLIVRERDARGS